LWFWFSLIAPSSKKDEHQSTTATTATTASQEQKHQQEQIAISLYRYSAIVHMGHRFVDRL
jgi:hypothetical protein